MISVSDLKSPLRYPGGKTRAAASILELIPDGTEHICSPFLGGGSVELALAGSGVRIFGYDAFEPLINFWKTALNCATDLADEAEKLYPMSREDFYSMQSSYSKERNTLKQAAMFYALNRSSFSGTTLSGGMSPGHPRFTLRQIEQLRDFTAENLQAETSDFADSIPAHSEDFLFLDPPYCDIDNLYGMKGDMSKNFDHEKLADILSGCERWLLCYNDHPKIADLYKEYKIVKPEWSYGMNASKQSSEVFILSEWLSDRTADYSVSWHFSQTVRSSV